MLIAASSDIALIVDQKGIIRDLAFGNEELSRDTQDAWVGRSWIETVTMESRPKVEQLLREADGQNVAKARELNHRLSSGIELPVRYSAARMSRSGPLVAMGRDLRVVAKLQQRLVDAQRSMERDYLRLRSAETRYRLLFQLSSEAVLILDASSLRVVDMNPAAGNLLETTPGRVVGRSSDDIFDGDRRAEMTVLFDTARTAGRVEASRTVLANRRECFVSASLFRQDDASHLLLRLSPVVGEGADFGIPVVKSQVLQVIESLPEAFIITSLDRVLLDANKSFLEIAELSSFAQARGQSVDRWLGRSSVDANVLFANLREHGVVRDFGTAVRSDFGTIEEVEISGVSVPTGDHPCYGLVIRSLRRRIEPARQAAPDQSRSASQLSELVGRVPLKDLVRETTELTEKLCIEASLKLTGDNRAAAAQMLGLSRQSLYSKLRRYNLGDLGPEEEDL